MPGLRRWSGVVLGLCLLPLVYVQSAGAAEDPLAGDARLNTGVEVAAAGVPVSDLLTALGDKTGVRLTAAPSTADDKVVVVSPARPLRETLADLAALLNDRWQARERPGRPVAYELERSPAAANLDQKLLRERTEHLLTALDGPVRAFGETPEQLAMRPPDDRIRKVLSNPSSRLATYLYGFTNTLQRRQLVAEGRLSVPFAGLRADQQQLLRQEFAQKIEEQNRFLEGLRAQIVAGGAGAEPDLAKIDASMAHPEDLEKHGLEFQLRNENGAAVATLKLGQGSRVPLATLGGETQWIVPLAGDPYSRQPVAKESSPPSITALQDALKEKRWVDRLRKLSQLSGRPVLADFYRGVPLARSGKTTRNPLPDGADPRAALDHLAEADERAWWNRGKTVLFRRRDWYAQQLYEVPDRWLHNNIQHLTATQGTPTVGDLLALRELTLTQVIGMNALPDRQYYELEPDGRGCNLQDLGAALNLLEWSGADPRRPLLSWRGMLTVTPEIRKQIQVPLPPLKAAQSAFVGRFLAGKPEIGADAKAEAIGLELTCNLDDGVKGVPGIPMGYANVDLSWTYPGRAPEQVHVLLPLEWPEKEDPQPAQMTLH
jgi:hypothetical protein